MDHSGIAAFVGAAALWYLFNRNTSYTKFYPQKQTKAKVQQIKHLDDCTELILQSDKEDDDILPPTEGQREFDVIIVGAGLSGLKAAHTLRNKYGIHPSRILILEAQDYVGGRIKQSVDFIPGCKIDLGAEFIHGDNSMLNEFAEETQEPLQNLFCWAHGDGGPSENPVDDDGVLGYGLYFFAGGSGNPSRLLRFDDESPDFVELNKILRDLR